MIKLLVRLFVSLLIGGSLLYLAALKIDFSSTWSALAEVQWWTLLPYFLVMAIQHFFRAWRWGHLLAPIHPVPFSRLLPIASVGFCAIIALPLRMGEFVRPYLIADPPRISMSQGIGTLAVERVFDGLILSLTCFSVVTWASRSTEVPGWLMVAALVALGLFCAALVVLVMTLWQRERAITLCQRLFGLFSLKLGQRLGDIARGIVDGFQVLPNWRRLSPYLAGTLAYWFLNGVAVWTLSYGFKLDLSLYQSMAVISVVGIGIMIPGGPGFIGNFELFANGALSLYVPPALVAQRGAAFILTFHATNALWYAVTGALALLSPQVTFHNVWQASSKSNEKLDKPGCSADAK